MTLAEKRTVFLFGAFGGILPTLANLAPQYITDWHTALPTLGFWFGLFIWAVVGGGMALTNATAETRQAIFAAVVAPALLTNITAGASEANMRRRTSEIISPNVAVTLGVIGSGLFISGALAETSTTVQRSTTGYAPNAATTAQRPGTTVSQASPIAMAAAAAAAAAHPPVVIFHPKVDGPGAPTGYLLKVTAQVARDGRFEQVPIGYVTNLSSDSALPVPAGTNSISVDGKSVPVEYPVTDVSIDLKTRTSKTYDFFWAMGVPRDYKVQDVRVGKTKD